MKNDIITKLFLEKREQIIRDIVARHNNRKNKISFSEFMHLIADKVDEEKAIEKPAILEERRHEEELSWEQDMFVNTVFGS